MRRRFFDRYPGLAIILCYALGMAQGILIGIVIGKAACAAGGVS